MNRILGPLVILLVLLLGGVMAYWFLAPRAGGAGGLGGVAGGPGGDGQDGGSDDPAPLDPLATVEAPTKQGEADGTAPDTAGSEGDGAEASPKTKEPDTPTSPAEGSSRAGVSFKLRLATGGALTQKLEFRGIWVAGTEAQPSLEAIGSILFFGHVDGLAQRLRVPEGSHPRGDGKAIRLQLQITGGPYELAATGRAGAFLDLSDEVQTVTLTLLPSVHLEVLDASDRSPLELVSVDRGHIEATDQPGWFLLYRPSGENIATLSAAPAYSPKRVTLQLPQSGTSRHHEPILLERGLQLFGSVRDDSGKLPRAIVVAERADGDPANPQFIMTHPGAAPGGYAFVPLPPGRYRVMWFAKGMAPHAEVIDLQDHRPDHNVKLRALGAAAGSNPRPYRWADRKHIKFPLSVDGLNGLEIIQWVEEILGAPIQHDAEVDAKLKEVHMSVSFTEVPVTSALSMFAQFTGFEFDAEKGAFTRPSKKK